MYTELCVWALLITYLFCMACSGYTHTSGVTICVFSRYCCSLVWLSLMGVVSVVVVVVVVVVDMRE